MQQIYCYQCENDMEDIIYRVSRSNCSNSLAFIFVHF